MVELVRSRPDAADRIVDGEGVSSYEFNNYNEEVERAINSYVRKTNIAAVAPVATNDASEGYGIGSEWLDTTGPTWYKCSDATTGAAVWGTI